MEHHMRERILQLLGPFCGAVLYLLLAELGHGPAAMSGIVLWMAIWWIGEAVPLAVTSLLPIVLFPLLGIDTVGGTTANYGKEIIYLFLGGFLLALALERSELHRRIALHVLVRVGGSGPRLIGGIMIATALLSMWMNSTSCVLVMLPIALSLLDGEGDAELRRKLTIPLLLAVAYAATIGGMATPVGTPPNLIFLEIWRERWPDRPPLGFGRWLMFGLPFMVIYLAVAWWLLTRLMFKVPEDHLSTPAEIRGKLKGLGRITKAEVYAACVFGITAILWITGDDIPFSNDLTLHGWRTLTGAKAFTDGAVAMLGAIVLFLIPVPIGKDPHDAGERGLMTWRYAEAKVPWGVLLIFGAGFAIGSGIERSGLAGILVEAVQGWGDLPHWTLIGTVSALVCFLSELGSNTATASLTLPILAESATAWGVDPQALLIPATLAATLGFSLPVASPMLAIVFGTRRIPVRSMMPIGILMDLIGIALLVLFFGW